MPDAFVFDIGNVIISFDFSIAANKIAPNSDVPADEALAHVGELTHALEMGEISTDDFLREAIAKVGYRGSSNSFREAIEDIFALNEPMVRFIEEQAAAGTRLYLLSNTNGIHVPFFERTYQIFSHFHDRIYSHDVGMMKPDPAIFALAAERFDLTPSSTVYIDDLPANCAAGREAGLITLQYDLGDHDRFLSEVSLHL